MELFGYGILNIVIAAAVAWLIWRTGFRILRSMAQPIPEPPPLANCARSRSCTGARFAERRSG